ncbi:MAG: hypothetical protein GQ535_04785 [Rhodobacteraceae bacterium]|nr:hypothetical protein [Paracoccaceae bacterium]
MLKALAILPLLAAPASAYTFVYQCEMGMGGAIVIDGTPDRLSFEITYEFAQPVGWMAGSLGEIEITLNEIDDFVIVASTAQLPDSSPEHEVTIHTSGSATYQLSTPENAVLWVGECENMRPE